MGLAACGNGAKNQTVAQEAPAPPTPAVVFDADSAYAYVARQTAFGPRVPNTDAHRGCAAWLIESLRGFGAQNIVEQRTQLQAWDGTPLNICNITARYNPEATKRILLLSHWDSRPWADHDPDPALRDKPIDGANDGASGVGVILEIARQLGQKTPGIGVDILLTDAEDYGMRAGEDNGDDSELSWCLGTQYWVANPTIPLEDIRYAILLDMVGGKDATFRREYFSERKASNINDKVWRAARDAGYSGRFVNSQGTAVIDDHVHLLGAHIPAVDIIETGDQGGFNPTWHTHADNIDNIDPATLKAVGQTLLNLIYSE